MFSDFDLDLPGFDSQPNKPLDRDFEGLLGNLPASSGFVSQQDHEMEEQARQEIARLQAEEMGLPYEPPAQTRQQPQRNVEVVRRTQT